MDITKNMQVNEKRLVETFINLVTIDSPSGYEVNVLKYIEKRLDGLNIPYEVDKAGNLFARVGGIGEPLVLCAHVDTVEPGRNIHPKIQNEVIVSGGETILGADNKVAVAAILELLEMREKLGRALEVVFSVREETDGGINNFDFKKLKGKIGLIADRASDVGSVVYTSPWIYNLTIKIIGKTAHAGMPEKGINALSVAASAITKIKLGRIDKKTTANIGLINGGTAMNSIPGEVDLIGEVRSFSKQLAEKNLMLIEKVFENEAVKEGAKVKIVKNVYCSGYVYKKTDEAVKRIIQTNSKMGVSSIFEVSFGASDANTFIENRIRMVNIGDGSRDPHTIHESVSIKNLVKLTRLFYTYVSI